MGVKIIIRGGKGFWDTAISAWVAKASTGSRCFCLGAEGFYGVTLFLWCDTDPTGPNWPIGRSLGTRSETSSVSLSGTLAVGLRGQFNYYKISSLIRIYQNWGQFNHYKILNILIWTYFGGPQNMSKNIL